MNCLKTEKDDATKRSDKIDENIRRERQLRGMTHRLLLLGTEESGKSTILNQLKILNLQDFDMKTKKTEQIQKWNLKDEMISVLKIIKSRIIKPAKKLYNLGCRLGSNAKELINDKTKKTKGMIHSRRFYDASDQLWKDETIEEELRHSNEYYSIDSAYYFMDDTSIIPHCDHYSTSHKDESLSRTATLVETHLQINNVKFHLFDVSEQKDERRKWLHYFDDVTAIIFIVDASSFDQLRESLSVFHDVWHHKDLKSTSVILFLNKQDVLKKKILTHKSKLEDYFPDFFHYKLPTGVRQEVGYGMEEVARAQYFIRDEFLKMIQGTGAHRHCCYPHFTSSQDKSNVNYLFNDCKDIFERKQLSQYEMF